MCFCSDQLLTSLTVYIFDAAKPQYFKDNGTAAMVVQDTSLEHITQNIM